MGLEDASEFNPRQVRPGTVTAALSALRLTRGTVGGRVPRRCVAAKQVNVLTKAAQNTLGNDEGHRREVMLRHSQGSRFTSTQGRRSARIPPDAYHPEIQHVSGFVRPVLRRHADSVTDDLSTTAASPSRTPTRREENREMSRLPTPVPWGEVVVCRPAPGTRPPRIRVRARANMR